MVTRERKSFVTDELVDQFVVLYEKGETTTNIGEKLGVNATTVRKYLIKRGVQIRGSNDYIKVPDEVVEQFVELYREGLSSVQIGKQTGYSKPVVLKYLRIRGIEMRGSSDYASFTEDQKESMKEMYELGASCMDIVNKYGTSPENVRRHLIKKGVEMRPVGGNQFKIPDHIVNIFVNMYNEGKSTVEIAREMNVGTNTVYVHLIERGVQIRPLGWKSRVLTDTQEAEIVSSYNKGAPAYKIAEERGLLNKTLVLRTLEKYGINRRVPQETSRVYTLNPHAFDVIDNELAAYWLGFIYADGHISDNRSLIIGLSAKDANHLKKLAEYIETDMEVNIRPNGEKYMSASICAHNQHLAQTLSSLGVISRRPNFNLAWDNVPDNMKHHFIRGIFDGDGSAKLNASIDFMGQEHMMEVMREWFSQNAGTNPNLKIVKHSISDIYYLHYSGGNVARKVASLMYKGATVWLERKRDRVNNWPYPTPRGRDDLGRWK